MKRLFTLLALLPLAAFGAPPEWANNDRNNAQGGDAEQGQLQGQAQGQVQGNFNAVDASNNSRTTATSGSISGSESSSAAQSASSSESSAVSDSSATQSQNASADNSGNTQSVTYNEAPELATKTVRSGGTLEVRSVPTAIAPNVYPTASCAMSASVGASAMGWGVSGGGTKVNEECMQLEAARMFSQLGYLAQGLTLACSTKSALAVYGTAQACLDAGTRYAVEAPVVEPVVPPKPTPAKVEATTPFGEVK